MNLALLEFTIILQVKHNVFESNFDVTRNYFRYFNSRDGPFHEF